MRCNPQLADHPVGHPIRSAQAEFNITYSTALHLLDRAFDGSPAVLADAIRAMYTVRAAVRALMRMPDGVGRVAGPTFDYVPLQLRR